MPQQFVISVMAEDRVGIVADVSGVIKNLEGSLADMSQTVLRGHFTMILVARFPDSVTPERLRAALRGISEGRAFEVGVIQTPGELPAEAPETQERRYVLTAAGPDRIGLVSTVTELLRQKGVNIEDLATRVDSGSYTMILLLNLPAGMDVARLKHSLKVAMSDIDTAVNLQHHEIFRATNEI